MPSDLPHLALFSGSSASKKKAASSSTMKTRKSRKATTAKRAAGRAAAGIPDSVPGIEVAAKKAQERADKLAEKAAKKADESKDGRKETAAKPLEKVRTKRGRANGLFLNRLYSLVFKDDRPGGNPQFNPVNHDRPAKPPAPLKINMGPLDLKGV
jgi:hypothetical protein